MGTSMFLFKYYRPDFFFDKAIRYNEFYFSARAQLNDPNDLSVEYRFDNKLNLWDLLLHSKCDKSYSDLNDLLDLNDMNIHRGLNSVFRGARIKNGLESLDVLFDSHADEIREIIKKGLLPIANIKPAIYGNNPDPEQFLVTLCENSIKERLYRKIVPGVYSVSFSSKALDRMMWAHYAAGFSGCVVIYEAKEVVREDSTYVSMQLIDNILSSQSFNFPVKPVIYSNQAKEVSLLGPNTNITKLFLTKNRFWKYESEYRMFIPEANAGIGNERHFQGRVNRNVGLIFHHDTNAIKGVIFGPRMSDFDKEKTWQYIKSNMENSSSQICYFFYADLSSSGKVTISKGQQAKKMQGFELFRTGLSGTKLTTVLKEMGITK